MAMVEMTGALDQAYCLPPQLMPSKKTDAASREQRYTKEVHLSEKLHTCLAICSMLGMEGWRLVEEDE